MTVELRSASRPSANLVSSQPVRRRTDKDLGPGERRHLDRDALLPVGTEDFRVLARVGDDDEMCRSLGENLFPELACSTAPVSTSKPRSA